MEVVTGTIENRFFEIIVPDSGNHTPVSKPVGIIRFDATVPHGSQWFQNHQRVSMVPMVPTLIRWDLWNYTLSFVKVAQ